MYHADFTYDIMRERVKDIHKQAAADRRAAQAAKKSRKGGKT
jgi:hypothetical protein